MVVNIPKKLYNNLLAFAAEGAIHGPKYFLNRGCIEGGKDIKTKNKKIKIKMSRFDR